jgi:hypothetical protein
MIGWDHMTRWILLGALIALAGCDCKETRTVTESMYSNPALFEIDMRIINAAEKNGADCSMEGYVRNGAGTAIGERWVCTRCD